MASFNVVLEDSSPLIQYFPPGAWSDSPLEDPLLASYSGQSYHSTSSRGATATVEFYGTGITLLGGKRGDHGTYAFSVDGNLVVPRGDARGPQNQGRQPLATISDLPPGKHRAVFENLDGLRIDIDAILIADKVGSPGAGLEARIIDDVDAQISYFPSPAAWGQNQLPIFEGGTIHFSQDPSAAASTRFQGDAIAIYGTSAPDHAGLRVTLDGEVTIVGGGRGHVNRLHSKVLLYYRSGLRPGDHDLNLAVHSPNSAAPFIDLDSITIFSGTSISNTGGSRSGLTPRPSATAAGTSRNANTVGGTGLSTGALAGAIVAGVVGFLACILLCIFAWRWRRRKRQADDALNEKGLTEFRSTSPLSPTLPMQPTPGPTIQGKEISAPLESRASPFIPKSILKENRLSIAPSYYSSPDSGSVSGRSPFSSNSSRSPLVGLPAHPSPRRAPRDLERPAMPKLPYSPSVSSLRSYESGYSKATAGVRPSLPLSARVRTSSAPSAYSRDLDSRPRASQRPVIQPI